MMKQTDLRQCLRLWKLCSHKIFWAHFGNNAQYCNLRMSFDSCIILIKWYLFSFIFGSLIFTFFIKQHLDYLDYITQSPWILSLSLWAIEETLEDFHRSFVPAKHNFESCNINTFWQKLLNKHGPFKTKQFTAYLSTLSTTSSFSWAAFSTNSR